MKVVAGSLLAASILMTHGCGGSHGGENQPHDAADSSVAGTGGAGHGGLGGSGGRGGAGGRGGSGGSGGSGGIAPDAESDPEVVKGFTLAGGVKVLAAQATNNHAVALSDTAVVWIGTTGPQRHEGNYETAQLFWAAWPDPLGSAAVQTGPSLPAAYGLSSLATAGDYAATIGCAQGGQAVDSCELFVVRLSTGKLWRIARRSGGAFIDVMAVTSDEIVLSEIDFPNGYSQVIQRFVRLGLAHLDELASG